MEGPQEWESFDLDTRENAEHLLRTSDALGAEIVASNDVAELVQRLAAFLFWGPPVRPKLGDTRRKKLVALFEKTLERLDEPSEESVSSSRLQEEEQDQEGSESSKA